MFRWTRIATLAAVAAVLAIATGVAGATSNPGSVPAGGSQMASAGKITTAAARRAALLEAANLRTRAGAARYLRAIGVNPHHFVIQRGIRNYAGEVSGSRVVVHINGSSGHPDRLGRGLEHVPMHHRELRGGSGLGSGR